VIIWRDHSNALLIDDGGKEKDADERITRLKPIEQKYRGGAKAFSKKSSLTSLVMFWAIWNPPHPAPRTTILSPLPADKEVETGTAAAACRSLVRNIFLREKRKNNGLRDVFLFFVRRFLVVLVLVKLSAQYNIMRYSIMMTSCRNM
jgi:hypothetical protein